MIHRPKVISLFVLMMFVGISLARIEIKMPAKASLGGKFPEDFKVIPKPKEVKLLNGVGLEFNQLNAIRLKGGSVRPVMGPMLSGLVEIGESGKRVLTLELANDIKDVNSPEGYVLTVHDNGVVIKAKGQAGLFYGCQTLEQLLEDAFSGRMRIPACKIVDYPALTYRAVHIDVKHHLDNMKYYYDMVDRLASYKINAIIFEFEDKLRYRRQPLVGTPNAISIDEMAAFVSYAKERHIEVSPLVQGLGHASFILKHDEYAKLREDVNKSWAFCPLDEGTYKVLFDMYLDAIEATPGSRYLHIGGDEIGEIGKCPRCKAMAEKDGVFALNLYWLKRVCEFVQQHGRTPIFWDDMPIKYAGLWKCVRYPDTNDRDTLAAWEKGEPILDGMAEQYPKNCVYMRWTYTLGRQLGNVKAIDWYRKHNLKTMVATAAQNVSYLLPNDDRVNLIQSFVGLGAEKGVEGMLCTAWDDQSPHMETYWRGLVASGEFSWSPTGRDLKEYETAYLHRWFGRECEGFDNLYADLYKGVEFWGGAFLIDGERGWKEEKMMEELPDSNAPGQWSKKYQKKITQARIEIERYKKTSKQLAELKAKARYNHYHIDILTVTNDFQITSAEIILALAKCDTANKMDFQEGVKDFKAALDSFNKKWEKLEEVYSKTRFINNPAGFVSDAHCENRYLGRWERLDWTIRFEKKYIKLIEEWLKNRIN